MNIKALATAAAIIASPFISDARAAFFTGNDLLAQCNGRLDVERGLCLGYITGAAQAGSGYCTPHGVTFGQMYEVVLQYLHSYPQALHYAAEVLVSFAMQGAFPCSK